IEVVDLFSNQQMIAVWERIECRSQRRTVWRVRLPLAGSEVLPSCGTLQGRWPRLEITRQGSERGVGEDVHSAFGTSIGDSILDRANETAASCAVVDFSQDRMLRGDGAIRSALHIGSSRPIDVVEKGDDHGAEDGDPDQRPLERR